ncbi:hypothetical protein BDN70DRAFT_853942 [Pholiota conissans]|uniref:BAG domain-containing protein n=1 Tax=Pholiota conissans TaxID=109636 RepID=A0A9P6D3J7_9AGAR|nr:hypothetical protein BDN70DRAFT_853942 [Pholiota conissans]
MPVTVRWGDDSFSFSLPRPDTKLAAVRNSIAGVTGLSPGAFHIVHDGAVLADDSQPISAYHLRPNSTLAVVADAPPPPRLSRSEHAQIAAIDAELTAVDASLRPDHARLLADLASHPRAALAKDYARISELLLQALLRVDGIVPEHEWHTARADRKAAVKQLQGLLDQLDAAWADSRT